MRERSQVFTAVLKMSDQLAQMDVCVAEMNIVLHMSSVAPVNNFVLVNWYSLRIIGELYTVLEDCAIRSLYNVSSHHLA